MRDRDRRTPRICDPASLGCAEAGWKAETNTGSCSLVPMLWIYTSTVTHMNAHICTIFSFMFFLETLNVHKTFLFDTLSSQKTGHISAVMYIPFQVCILWDLGGSTLNIPSFMTAPLLSPCNPKSSKLPFLPLGSTIASTISCFPIYVHYIDTISTPVLQMGELRFW